MRECCIYRRFDLVAGLLVAVAFAPALSGAQEEPVLETQPAAGEGLKESTYASDPRDAIDAAAPHDADAARILQRAEAFLAAKRWDRAQDVLLYALDRFTNSLVRLSDGRLSPVADEANRLLGQLPPDALELYRRQYSRAAEVALAEAIASGRREGVEQVAVQFHHTEAGQAAQKRLAAIHFDRGEFGLAARSWQAVSGTLEPALRVRAAYALAAIGQTEQAHEMLATLSEKDRAALASVLQDGPDSERFVSAAAASVPSAKILADWPMPFGDASGSAVALDGEPILLRRWFQPLTHRAHVQEQIDRTTLDLRDAGRATIPAGIPLAIGDRIAFRTLRGISVHDASDGHLIWETDERASAEQILGAGTTPADMDQNEVIRLRFQFGPDPSGGSADHRPLANLFYRDGVYGLISSDRERLYVVENHAALVRPDINGGWPGQTEPEEGGAALTSNRLVAYDAGTGRPAWLEFGGLGGVADGPFTPPLAGSYFFGPPVSAGGELFAVAERNKEIKLISLDAASGLPRWERLLADAPTSVGQDRVRRGWPAQPAVAEGVIVCPTTVGWLMGLDRSSRSIIWAHRYSSPRSDSDGDDPSPSAVATPLNSRWSPAAPIISKGRVVYAPAEEQKLVCLDLSTGELVWRRDKRNQDLYVAGIAGDCVVVVGTRSIEAIDLREGTTRWTLPIAVEEGPPSGRAVLTKEALYVPMRGECLWKVDVASGKISSETMLPAGEGTLGTLLMHRGTLLSFAASGLIAFEERTRLVRSVEDRLKAHPKDVAALLQRAELQYAEGRTAEAVTSLDLVDSESLSADQAARYRALRWDVLAALAQSDQEDRSERLDELVRLASAPEQRFLVRRLRADRDAAAGEMTAAARGYLSLLQEPSSVALVEEDGGRRRIRLDNWLAGRFEDLWNGADADARGQLDAVIGDTLQAATSPDERSRLASLFAFHPLSYELRRELAREDVAAGRLAEAEIRLLPLTRQVESAVQAGAFEDLAAASTNVGLGSDANYWNARATVVRGDAGADAVEESPAGAGQTSVRNPLANHWGDFRLTIVRSGNYIASESAAEVRPDQVTLPYYRERKMRLLTQQDRLAVSGPGGRDLEQLIPLRGGSRSGARTIVTADGHLLFVLHRGVVQVLSPAEGRILWSAPAEDDTIRGMPNDGVPGPMQTGKGMLDRRGLVALSRTRDSMPAANASYVVVRGRRTFTVHDAATGEVLWTRNDIPRAVDIIGTDRLIYILPRGNSPGMVYRAVDGKPLEMPSIRKDLPRVVATVGDRLLTLTIEDSLRFLGLHIGGKIVLSLIDAESGKPQWTLPFPAESLFDRLPDGRLAVLTPVDGKLVAVDAATGKTQLLGQVPLDALRRRNEVVLVTDSDSAFVLVNSGRISQTFATAELPAVAASGEIFAFDVGAGELKWQRTVTGQRLLCQEFDQMPVLLFVDSERTQKGNQSLWQVNLLALDKRTGEPVLDEPFYTSSTPFFRNLSVQPERSSIELTAYHARLRLQAIPTSQVSDQPAATPVPQGD